MTCQRCGATLALGSQFCSTCGTPIGAPPPLPVQPPPLPAVGGAAPAAWAPPPMPPPAPAPAAPVDAGFWLRFAASILDGFIVGFASWILLAIVLAVGAAKAHGAGDPSAMFGALAFGYVLALLVQWLYFALQEAGGASATVGKRACGLAVVDLGGARIGFGRATGRHFGKLLSSIPFGVGFLLAGFTEKKQALHDMVAGTRVVRARQSGGAAAVVVVAAVAGLFVVVAIVGILAAIAIPNFLRYQLRTKAGEGKAEVAAIVKAELAYAQRNGKYLGFAAPEGAPGRAKLPWSAEELQAAGELDWMVSSQTYFTYRVAVGVTDAGRPAFAVCAESDLDGDGAVAAVVAWVPAEDSGGALVAPAAPCQHDPQLERSLEWSENDPVGTPVSASPDGAF